MKYCFCFIALSIAAFAQSTTTTYTSDLNGGRVAGPSTVTNGPQSTLISQSINGRKVPMEETEEKVLSQSSSGRTLERIVKHYDPNGGLAGTDRIVIEESKLPDGTRTRSTTYRKDLNGRAIEAERRTVETHTQGTDQSGSSTTQTEVARPDPTGSFQVAEKSTLVSQISGTGKHTDSTIYRPNGNGGYDPAVRDISDSTTNGSQITVTSAHYEPRASQQLQLTSQTVTNTTKRADGSTVSEISLYGTTGGDGRAHDNQTAPRLREVQTVEKIPGRDGSVTEIVNARRPSMSDPNRLGPTQKLSETICIGMCK